MDSCSLYLSDGSIQKAIEAKFGPMKTKAVNCMDYVIKEGEFTPEFKEWYKKKFKKELSVTSRTVKTVAERAVQYYEETAWKVDEMTEHRNTESENGYYSVADYERGKAHVVNTLQEVYDDIEAGIFEQEEVTRDFIKQQAIRRWNNHIFKLIAKKENASISEIIEEFNALGDDVVIRDWIKEKLSKDGFGIVEQNLLAVWDELNGDPASVNKYLKEVLADPKLNGLFTEKAIDDDVVDSEKTDNPNGDGVSTEDGVITSGVTDDTDKAISQANSHDGAYSTFLKHLDQSPRVKHYFNSLKKLADVKKDDNQNYIEDTDNSFGIAETMSAEECARMLYSESMAFGNPKMMIEAIRRIAASVPGYECFAKLADDLEADPDLCNELSTIFKKTRVSKMMLDHKTVGNRKVNTIRESNTDSSKDSTMLFDLRNDARYVIPQNTHSTIANNINDYVTDIKTLQADYSARRITDKARRDYEKRYNDLLKLAVDSIRAYFPSLDEEAILKYIVRNNDAKEDRVKNLENIRNILDRVASLNANASTAYGIYEGIQTQIDDAKTHNAKVRAASANPNLTTSSEDYKDVNALRTQDFLTPELNNDILLVKNMFKDYSIIQVSFNSTNSDNKMSTDILNNSMITRLIRLLESGDKDLVEKWGARKLRSHHYRYSNILLEERDARGNLIHKGLFRRVGKDKIVCSDDCLDLLKFYLFDGARNSDNGKSSTYSKMTSGDFAPTVYSSFFNPTPDTEGKKKEDTAIYFLRTPSDAPKTFTIKAPRYSTKDLFTYSDEGIVKKFISNIIKSIPVTTQEIIDTYIDKTKQDAIKENVYSLEAAIDVLTERKDQKGRKINLYVNDKVLSKVDGKGYTGIVVQNENKNPILIIVKGDVEKRGNRTILNHPEIVSYHNMVKGEFKRQFNIDLPNELPKGLTSALEEYYRKKLDKGETKFNGKEYDNVPVRQVNTRSNVFKMVMNKVQQELFNMMNAIDFMFETNPDGSPKLYEEGEKKGQPILKPGFDEDSAYDWYHKVGTIFKKVGNHYELTGNVFNSNLLTLFINGKKRNYLMEVITQDSSYEGVDKLNLLYGGADGKQNIKVTKIKDNNDASDRQYPESVDLDERQRNILEQAVVNFITDYLNQAQEQVNSYKDFISESTDAEHVTDFAMNYFLTLTNYDELLEGSSKFYKDSRTLLKRAKEYQGSGVPYGTSDYYTVDDESDHEVPSLLNSGYVLNEKGEKIEGKDIFKGTRLEGLNTTSTFKAVTIYNTKQTNHPALEMLRQKLINDLGVDEKTASELLYGRVKYDNGNIVKDENGHVDTNGGGFTGTKVNDAQSYITFEEWIRRVASKGQLKRYLPLIKRILNAEKTGKPLSVSDIKEFIQVQKNFYYDLHYDEASRMEVPRQIKNAELVLVPCLIKGTQLEEVYNMMKEAGIDQLNTIETSKAANHNTLRLWDNDGNISGEAAQEFVEKASEVKETYSYNYLYTQQETPQHLDAKNKAGIQIVKKIIDNIDPQNSNPTIVEAKNDFLTLMSENIYDSYQQLFDALEISYDRNGDIASMNKKVFFDKLREQLEIRGMDKNMYDYVDVEGRENPRMPIARNDILNTFESIVQSVFNNNITTQKLPGFHAAQVTNIGFRAGGNLKAERLTPEQLINDADFKEFCKEKHIVIRKENGKYKISDLTRELFGNWINERNGSISYSKDLKYHQKVNPKTGKLEYAPYIEIMLPLSNFGIDRTKGRWRNMKDDEILRELQAEGLDMVIGYRIPTEGKQSACLMKVVGFIPDGNGSTICVPNDWVSQTGSDFDIDSVYGIQFNTYFDNDGKIHKIGGKKDKKGYNPAYKDRKPTYLDYYRYVMHKLDEEELPENATTSIKEKREEIKQYRDTYFRQSNERYNDALQALNIFNIKAEANELYEQSEEEEDEVKSDELYNKSEILDNLAESEGIVDILNKIQEGLSSIKKYRNSLKYDNKRQRALDKATDTRNLIQEVYDTTSQLKSDDEFTQEVYDELNNRIKNLLDRCKDMISLYNYNAEGSISEQAAEDIIDDIEDSIEGSGIMSYEEWSSLPAERRASRKERDNAILDAMEYILSDDDSLEEQLSRSNFDDITQAMKDMLGDEYKDHKEARSPYNIFDQIAYQEDAMSGAELKALSVSLDTFCSVCNQVKPNVRELSSVYIIYDRGDISNPDKVVDRYNIDGKSARVLDNGFEIRHKTYGWSKDNKNVAGKILTSYSSQTTAHILDAIKEGSAPNVNSYTFGVYKTLANMGVDYNTIISFMAQPGVERIVKAYNAGHSLYYESFNTPLNEAIKDIARDLDIEFDTYETVTNILSKINEKYGDTFKEIFGEKTSITLTENGLYNLPIIASKLEARLKGGEIASIRPVEEIVRHIESWTRASATKDTNTLYVFTDNTDRDSGKPENVIDPNSPYAKKYGAGKHYPTRTQAVVRGLPNAMPISTQRWYHEGAKGDTGMWHDKDFDEFKKTIDEEVEAIKAEWKTGKYSSVAFGGEDGLFNGNISKISKERTPKLYDYLTKKYNELIDFIKDNPSDNTASITEETIEHLFDLGTILQFHKINSIANEINPIRRACTPDKFGAGKSAYAANKLFSDIYAALYKTDTDLQVAQEKSNKRSNPVLTVGGENMLESIYPGISKYGEDRSIKSTSQRIRKAVLEMDPNRSSYKTLASHLKYGTAFSVAVGAALIPTQRPEFVDVVMGLGKKLTDNFTGDISEELYNDFQKYLLNYIYNEMGIFSDRWNFEVTDGRLTGVSLDAETNRDEENARIFGYGMPDTIATVKGEGLNTEIVLFKVVDKNNPTQKEIEQFAQLSPAQKVKWIQSNSADAGVFGYLEASLYNPNARREKVGMQTIQYNDTGISLNTVRAQFMNAVNSTNPFIKIAALDLVKYSCKVEGFRLGKTSVSKVIDNAVLYNEFGTNGYGFVEDINDIMNGLNRPDSILSAEKIDQAYERFLRSKSDIREIKTINTREYTKKKYGMQGSVNGMYLMQFVFDPNKVKEGESEEDAQIRQLNEWRHNLSTGGFLREDARTKRTTPNEYIRVNDVTRGNLLYKIKDFGSIVYIYPLTNLQQNETSYWSANEDNNKTLWHKDIYEAIIQQSFNEGYNRERTFEIVAEMKDDGRFEGAYYTKRTTVDNPISKAAELQRAFNSGKDASLNVVKTEIKKHFIDGKSSEPIYVISSSINDFLFSKGVNYSANIRLNFGDTASNFKIVKPQSLSGAKKYLKDKINDKNRDYVYYVALANAVEMVEQTEPMAATVLDLDMAAVDFMSSQKAAFGDKDAINRLEKLRVFNVKSRQESINNNIDLVTQQVASFAIAAAKRIKDDFEHFMPNPDDIDGEWLPITDDKVQAAIANNVELYNKYLKVLNDIQAFKEKFTGWDEANSEEIDMKSYINTIQNAKDIVDRLPVGEADTKLIQGYITSQSTNPIIMDGLVNIMDGYYKTTGSMWAFHDIMENGNMLLQTILKDVMDDIEAKRYATIRRKEEFRSTLSRLMRAAGMSNLDKIITKDGRIIEDYSPEFIDKLEELREAKNQAAAEFGYGSIQFLKAKNDYDAFKATFCNQEANQEYYIHKAQAEKVMIENHPVLYEHYMKLFYEKIDLIQYSTENGIDDAIETRIQQIDQEMYNLRRKNYYVDSTGALKRRVSKNQPNANFTPEQKRELELYSIESQKIMDAFIEKIGELNAEYFHYEPVEGFARKLKENLNVIEKFEKRDANGVPTVPQSILDTNEQYVAARDWVRRNAYYELSQEEWELVDSGMSFEDRVKSALTRMAMSGNGNFAEINHIISNKDNWVDPTINPYDERGILDASKLKPETIKDIQDKVAAKYKFKQNRRFTDRILINSAPRNTEVYTQEFYNMMRSNGNENPAYVNKITQINNILRKYYNELTDTVDFSKKNIPATEVINDLRTLGQLFSELRQIHKNFGTTNGKDIADFIKDNVEYDTNMSAFMAQFAAVATKDTMFKEAWKKVNYEYDKDGNLVLDDDGNPVPNRFLYSVMKPKDSVRDRYLDVQATEDRHLIESVYRTTVTRYYEDTRAEMQRKDEEERKSTGDSTIFRDWFMANHIYNPYTHKMEPLPCWTIKEYNDSTLAAQNYKGEWIPKASQREKKVNDGMQYGVYDPMHDKSNHNYKPDVSLAENYIKHSENRSNPHTNYDNPIQLTDEEKAVRDFLKETLMQTATTDSARRYFKNGYLPARAKQPGLSDGKTLLKEAGKLFGFGISTNNGNKQFYDEIGYSNDVTPLMPLTKLIRTSDSKDFNEPKPTRGQFPATPDGQAQFQTALDEWKSKKKEIDDFNQKIHQDMLDRDWIEVIDDYLDLAGRYNAISDNKLKLYYLLNKLRDQKAFITSSRDDENLKHDNRRGDKDNPVLESAVDAELIKQYENFLRRLLFDQWKEQSGKLTRYANNLQGFTSANYMMLNFKGGIANVTLGETGILAEAAASEFFSYSDWAKGTAEWSQGIISYGRALGKDFSYSVQDAIIKALKVVDYDEHTGVVREAEYAKYSKKLRDAMFSPQTMGEHFMQNSVLFAMLHSHKIVKRPGSDDMTFMNQAEYVRTKEAEMLTTLLEQDQITALEEEKARLSKDKDELAEYAWYRKDFLNRFVYLHCSKQQRDAFYAKREALKEQSIKEFKELPDMRSQMMLGSNGKLAFVPNSQLDILSRNMTSAGVTQAERLLGEFTQRTKLVNNKIHGVYNRLGSAYIEKTWIGSLIMQYHKHLPMGLMKRYMKRGHYNETRGSIDKGMIWSIWDFLKLNVDKIKVEQGLTDANIGAVQSLQMLLSNSMAFLMNMRDTWKFTTDYDRANIRRNLGDLTGVTLAVLGALLLIMAGDDDDDSIPYNLALYEFDRLASESFLYNPVGLINESKKLMSTPIAAQSVITDGISAIGNIAGIIMQGEDFDPYYHSGRFAGEHKLSVYIQRRIPIWNGIRGIVEVPDNNHYYKVGKNPITILPLDKIAGKD